MAPAEPQTPAHHGPQKPWQSRVPKSHPSHDEERASRGHPRQTVRSVRSTKNAWWKTRLFSGMVNDVRRRAPFYASDWRDAWDYRVVPATVYMYFANILPALAFSLDMFEKTNESFGVNEVLLASVLGAVVFSLFAAQPLVIVGVTGPITVFNYTVYGLITPRGTNYFAFMTWIGLWATVMHWILAITNSCNALKYVTRFSCDIFGFYVAFIYLQKGIQVLTRQWAVSPASAYLSIAIALLVFGVAYLASALGQSTLLQRHVRKFVEDYGTPLTVIFFTGFAHIGHMSSIPLSTLPVSRAFAPTAERGWVVRFWDLSVGDVFLAIPFAVVLTVLFWFDHNVSSLIAQGTEFPLRKPAGFHWDIFLLGVTTGVAGVLGLPFPNGLIPQAPFHTQALCVTRTVAASSGASRSSSDVGGGNENAGGAEADDAKGHTVARVVDHVVEQRVSNLAQGLLTLGTMTGPLLIVLHLIPQAVLAGLFFVMGVQALEANGITLKLLFLLRDRHLTPPSDPLSQIKRKRAVWAFVALELVGFGVTFAITQTVAAIGFPIVIFAYIPLRMWGLPRWFAAQELGVLDAPTASAFTMESVGGIHGEGEDSETTSRGESRRSMAGEGVSLGEAQMRPVGEQMSPRRSQSSPSAGRRGEHALSDQDDSEPHADVEREGRRNAAGASRRRSSMRTREAIELGLLER